MKTALGVTLALLFFGALFWAREQDPFSRQWFTLKTADDGLLKCVVILPKPISLCPVIIYAHGSGGDLMDDGTDLRQMAELGLAVVSLEYDQTNEVSFNDQFEAVLHYIERQKWADTNSIAWVGFSLGANRMWDFALQHPAQQPQLLVQLSGAGLDPSTLNSQLLTKLHCSILLIHGDQDEIFPLENTKYLASLLQSNGMSAELKIIPNAPHGMEPEREVIFRCIGEYCLKYLVGEGGWQNYHSIAQWEAEAPPFWLFTIPAAAWAIGCFGWAARHKPIQTQKSKHQRHEIILRWLAIILAIWALSETVIHLVPPYLKVNDKTLSVAREYLVQPKMHADFEFLAAQPIWHEQKLETLLEHMELANYNRELINWQVDEKHYQDYILTPVITGQPGEKFNWRRPLWEEFYPRIRHESSPKDAARIVVRYLRERVTIVTIPNPPREISLIWRRQITDEAGFEMIYVAALRSVGVPARLDVNEHAEFWDGGRWLAAPGPVVESW